MRLASRHPRAFVFIVMPLSLRPCSDLAELVIDFARPAFAVVAQLGVIGFWLVNISNSQSVYCLVWTSKGSIDVFTCLRVYVFTCLRVWHWPIAVPEAVAPNNPVEPTAAGYGACKRRCGATCGNCTHAYQRHLVRLLHHSFDCRTGQITHSVDCHNRVIDYSASSVTNKIKN
jgi:hypothetical protein